MYVAHDVARSRSVFVAASQSGQHVVSMVHPQGAEDPDGTGGIATGLMTGTGRPSLYATANLPARTNTACAALFNAAADFTETMYPIKIPIPK